MELLEYPAGAVIFHAGEPSDKAYLIRTGEVELVRGGDGAAPLTRLGPGEVFGEMSLIQERPHSLTARAVGPVTASALTRAEFENLLTTDPATFRIYLTTLFERLRNLSARLEAAVATAAAPAVGIRVTIHPVTRRAAATLPDEGLPVTHYPFRIGRMVSGDEALPLDINELWLKDYPPFNVSRNHALLELDGDAVVVKDRGSSLGTYVNEQHIGGKSSAQQAPLEDGDNVVILGSRVSPYQFRVEVKRG